MSGDPSGDTCGDPRGDPRGGDTPPPPASTQPPPAGGHPDDLPGDDVIGPVYLDAATIAARVSELGRQITADHAGGDLLLVSVLKSAVFFIADLARAIDLPLEMDFLAITSYQQVAREGESHPIRFIKDLEQPIDTKDVVIVEDVIDTGLTLHYILRSLRLRSPRSLEVCTLLDRPYRRLADIDPRYVGFTVPDDFFVGYGFDHRQRYRNLPDLRYLLI